MSMKKQLISLLLVLSLAALPAMTGAMAEGAADPFEEITAEFAQAKKVEAYQVAVHPTRVSGWTALRWAPSKQAPIMATYPAKQELTVLKETGNWLLVENTQTGDVGYINKAYVTTEIQTAEEKELKLATEQNGKVNLGVIDINGAFSLQCGLPEGYTMTPVRSFGDQMVAVMTSQDPAKPEMVLSVAYDPAYASVDRLNDLDDEALAVLEKTFTDVDPTVEITYGDTGLGTRLLVARQNDGGFDYLDLMSIYKGYFVEFVMVAPLTAEEKALTEEQMRLSVDFLTDLDFVPVAGEADVKAQLADSTYPADLTVENAEERTVRVVVSHALTLTPEAAAALKVGDTLTLGQFSETIETLEETEDGDLLINGTIALRQYGEDVHLYVDEREHIEPFAELTVTLSDEVKFQDWLNHETWEEDDHATEYSAEELIAMIEADPSAFTADNVWVFFNEAGELFNVERVGTAKQ